MRFIEGQRGQFRVTTDAAPESGVELVKIGRFAVGVQFRDGRNSTATVSGTPRLGSAGVYTVVLRAMVDGQVAGESPFELTVVTMASPFKRSTAKKAAAAHKRTTAKKAARAAKAVPAKDAATVQKRATTKKAATAKKPAAKALDSPNRQASAFKRATGKKAAK